MKGKMIMERRDYSALTPEEIADIICEFNDNSGCGGYSCSKCIMNPKNYDNAPDVDCNHTFMVEMRKKANLDEGTIEQTDETIDTIVITPKTTNMDFLVNSDYIHILAAVLTMQNVSEICKKNNAKCINCKLCGKNFSKEFKTMLCKERIQLIHNVSMFLKNCGTDFSPKVRGKSHGTCESCKHLNKVGEYLFCNAWKNYTSSSMQCGYHEPIDK